MIQQHREALNFTLLPSFENWKAYCAKAESNYAYEIPLFTDAVLGLFSEFRLGPYEFIRSSLNAEARRTYRTVMVMRVNVHIVSKGYEWINDTGYTEDVAYHGGNLDDEMAALLSLLHGVRILKGSVTREFSSRGDVRGYPQGLSSIPALVSGGTNTIIPRLTRENLELFRVPDVLGSYPQLARGDAIALIKSARQYQQAVWYADADPSQAWLMLVSALETAANHWWQGRAEPYDLLEEGNKSLYDILIREGGKELIYKVAPYVVKPMFATRKFREFILKYLPGPPAERPGKASQFLFEQPNLSKALGKVYQYRSSALHDGRSWPLPMCMPPERMGGETIVAEIPLGEATGTLGSVWQHDDVPMYLHTFEHIARTSLIAWWHSMVHQ